MPRPRVWITGDTDNSCFTAATAWLDSAADCHIVPLSQSPTHGSTQAPEEPAAILFLQARPGSIDQDDIEQFHHLAPQARLLMLVGPWCDGELRSGRPCEGVARMHWNQWPARLPHELGLAGPSNRPVYRSRMITEYDILLRTLTPALHRPLHAGHIAVATENREAFSVLADACWAIGWRSVWQQPGMPPQFAGSDLLLIDGWRNCPRDFEPLRSPHRSVPPSVLLLDWPQQQDLDRASQLGISRVLARPLLLADLFATMDSVATSLASTRSAA